MPIARRVLRLLLYLILLSLSLFYLTPVYVMAVTSFKGMEEATLDRMWDLPSSFDLASYATAYEKLAPHLLNSLYLTIPATLFTALLGSLNGYVLSKWRFRGADTLFTLLLFGMFIPYQSILIPLIQFMQGIGLYNSIPGLILIHVVYGIPIATLIFRNFYAGIPTEILEAAKIDGCGMLGIYRRIILPLSPVRFCGGGHLGVYPGVERISFCRHDDHFHPAAGHGCPAKPLGQPDRAVERADGRRPARRAAHPAGVYFSGQVLHPRPPGRFAEGMSRRRPAETEGVLPAVFLRRFFHRWPKMFDPADRWNFHDG